MPTYEQKLLLRRMALHDQLQRMNCTTPRPEDEKYIPDAVRMLLYVACLNYAMLDLETALVDTGRLRLLTKHRFNQAQRLVAGTHGTAYDMLQRAAPIAARQYNDRMDVMYHTIKDCVLLSEPEHSYNVVVALCRLVSQLNERLTGRYDFAPARPLARIPSLLDCIGISDHRLDNIIELNTNDKRNNHETI